MIKRVGAVGPSRGGEKKSRFEYKPRTPQQVKQRAEQQGGRFDSFLKANTDMYRPKVGNCTIRILPPTWEDPEHYGFDAWVHAWVGPDKSTYLCLNKNAEGGGGCPICAAAKEALDGGDADEAKALQPTRRVLAWIIDRDSDTPHPIVWSMSWSQDRDIALLCTNKKTGRVLQIDSPYEGYDVSFSRVGQGLKTRYAGLAIDRDPSPVMDDEKAQDEILDFIQDNPLPAMFKFYDADYLEKVISGEVEKKDKDLDDEVEGEDERPSRSSKPSRRSSREDGEEVEERSRSSARRREADEEEERPTRRTKTDDDPDERPTRRSSAREEVDERPTRSSRRNEEEEEERPTRRTRDPEEEDRPRSRRTRDEEEEEENERPTRTTSRRSSASTDEEEEEERPRRRASRDDEVEERPTRSSRKPDPEEEEEEPEEEEEQEEEEEAPRRSSRR